MGQFRNLLEAQDMKKISKKLVKNLLNINDIEKEHIEDYSTKDLLEVELLLNDIDVDEETVEDIVTDAEIVADKMKEDIKYTTDRGSMVFTFKGI